MFRDGINKEEEVEEIKEIRERLDRLEILAGVCYADREKRVEKIEKEKRFSNGDRVVTCIGDDWVRGRVIESKFVDRLSYGSGYIDMWYYQIDSYPKWFPEVELLLDM